MAIKKCCTHDGKVWPCRRCQPLLFYVSFQYILYIFIKNVCLSYHYSNPRKNSIIWPKNVILLCWQSEHFENNQNRVSGQLLSHRKRRDNSRRKIGIIMRPSVLFVRFMRGFDRRRFIRRPIKYERFDFFVNLSKSVSGRQLIIFRNGHF